MKTRNKDEMTVNPPYADAAIINPCKIPIGIAPQQWINTLVKAYSDAYGILERGRRMLTETFHSLYEKAGVFVAQDNGDSYIVVELSKSITLIKAYEETRNLKIRCGDPSNWLGKAGGNTYDTYNALLEILSPFSRPYSSESRFFGNEEGVAIDELGSDTFTTTIYLADTEPQFGQFIQTLLANTGVRYQTVIQVKQCIKETTS